MFIHRIKKMPFDEDFAKYQRCLIASSIADTYEEAIQEWEVIDLEYHPDKDLISFSNRVRSHTGCTIRNLNTKITLGPFSQSGLKSSAIRISSNRPHSSPAFLILSGILIAVKELLLIGNILVFMASN